MKTTGCLLVLLVGLTFLFSCEKEPDIEPFYLKYTIDGESYEFLGDEFSTTPWFTTSLYTSECPDSDSIGLGIGSNFQTSLYDEEESSMFTIQFYRKSTQAELESLVDNYLAYSELLKTIQKGPYDFFGMKKHAEQSGIKLSLHEDAIGYYSFLGSSQTGLNTTDERFDFEVMEASEYTDDSGDRCLLVKTRFNAVLCSLNGDSLTLTDGEMKCLFKPYDQ